MLPLFSDIIYIYIYPNSYQWSVNRSYGMDELINPKDTMDVVIYPYSNIS